MARMNRSRRPNRFRPFRALGTAASLAYRAYNSYTKTKSRNIRSRENVTTGQKDFTNQYRFKRMPRRKRKKWVSFKRKVNAVVNKRTSRTFLFNDALNIDDTTVSHLSPHFASVCIAGCNGTEDSSSATTIHQQAGFRDLKKIIDALGSGQMTNRRFYCKSMILDVTLFNHGNRPVEIDVYDIAANKDVTLGNSIASNLTSYPTNDFYQVYESGASLQAVGGIVGSVLANRAFTPFSIPVCSSLLKIYRKRKFMVPPGSSVFLQRRVSKDWCFNSSGKDDMSMLKGITQGFFIVGKSVVNPDVVDSNFGLSIGASRTYNVSYDSEEYQSVAQLA